jgi:uncharacterized protein YggT (Ycf19 family)
LVRSRLSGRAANHCIERRPGRCCAAQPCLDFSDRVTKLCLVLSLLLDLYSLLVLLAVILSWVQVAEDNPLRRITDTVVEPVLSRIRKLLPTLGGLDFSPWVLLLALHLVRRML